MTARVHLAGGIVLVGAVGVLGAAGILTGWVWPLIFLAGAVVAGTATRVARVQQSCSPRSVFAAVWARP